MLVWAGGHAESSNKFESQGLVQYLVGFETESFRFWINVLTHYATHLYFSNRMEITKLDSYNSWEGIYLQFHKALSWDPFVIVDNM